MRVCVCVCARECKRRYRVSINVRVSVCVGVCVSVCVGVCVKTPSCRPPRRDVPCLMCRHAIRKLTERDGTVRPSAEVDPEEGGGVVAGVARLPVRDFRLMCVRDESSTTRAVCHRRRTHTNGKNDRLFSSYFVIEHTHRVSKCFEKKKKITKSVLI